MSNKDNTTTQLREQIRAAMTCDDREHLDSDDFEACYTCQVDKVLSLLSKDKQQLLERLLDQKCSSYVEEGFEQTIEFVTTKAIQAELKALRGEDNE